MDFDEITQGWVRGAIRAEMVRSGVTFGDLAHRLTALGANENERNLRNKVARGTFSATLFAQCLAAMGCKSLTIDLLDRVYAPSRSAPTRVTLMYGSPEQQEEVFRAVWAALRHEPPAGNTDIGVDAVRRAVARTDTRPYFSGEISLEEVVRRVRLDLGAI